MSIFISFSYILLGEVMRKFFGVLGLLSLIVVSFYVSDETEAVVRNVDELMVEIRDRANSYNILSSDALVNDNTIIPGIMERNLNVNKTYANMKSLGVFDDNFLVFNYKKPNISLGNIFDKYVVSGNHRKNMVSIVFLVNGNVSIGRVIEIFKNKNVFATFFIDGSWLELNNSEFVKLSNIGHSIGNLGDNMNYNNYMFSWVDSAIRTVNNQNIGFCFNDGVDSDDINYCKKLHNYVIRPSLFVVSDPLITVKRNVQSGSIISLPLNDCVIEELPLIIDYLKFRGFSVVNLVDLLDEKIY